MFISGVHNPAKQYCDLYVGPVGIASVIFPELDINFKDSIHGALLVSIHGTYGTSWSTACALSIGESKEINSAKKIPVALFISILLCFTRCLFCGLFLGCYFLNRILGKARRAIPCLYFRSFLT